MPSRAENDHNARWNDIINVTCGNSMLSKSVRKIEVTLTELKYHMVIVMQRVQHEKSVEVKSLFVNPFLQNQQLFSLKIIQPCVCLHTAECIKQQNKPVSLI